MRALTEKEKQLLVGGSLTTEFDTLEVFGFAADFGYSFDLWNDTWTWYHYDDYYGNSGDASGGPGYDCESFNPGIAEDYTDAKASEIARAIIAESNHTRVEYLAFIYRDGHGVIRSSELFGGTGDSVSINFETLGFPASQVIGIVHNHDRQHYGATTQEAELNRLPSDNDWAVADAFVAAGADGSVLSLYLLDTADAFRQYDYTAKSTYVESDGDIKPNAPLGAGTSKTLYPPNCPI